MASELDRKSDGSAAMFSVRKTPWHREGVILKEPPATIEEALRLAGLNFTVGLRSVFVPHHGLLCKVSDYSAMVRTDREAVLGIVGSRYQPLQNKDAFRILQPLVDSGHASFETAGSLRQGRDVWILVRFHVDDPVVQEVFASEVVPFGLLSNNHAGKRSVILQETPIRVVCANTLGAAHRTATPGRTFRIQHTINVEARTIEAAQVLWRAVIERTRTIAEQYRLLRRSYLDVASFRELVLGVAAPIELSWLRTDATKAEEHALKTAIARRNRIKHLWVEGKGHTGDCSAWEAYNAVVEAIDHDNSLWSVRSSRVQSLLDGRLGRMKQQVLNGLVEHALSGVRR